MKRTRKSKAADLLRLATNGPASLRDSGNDRAAAAYKLWSESWLLPLIKELVPEIAKGQVQ